MVINGKSWPHTERLTYPRGSTVRWRVINPTIASAPDAPARVLLPRGQPGRRAGSAGLPRRGAPVRGHGAHARRARHAALSWVPEREGNWVFHCHFAFHVSYHRLALRRADAATSGRRRCTHAPHERPGARHPRRARRDAGAAARQRDRPPREIRLLAQSAPRRYGTLAGIGYVRARTAPSRRATRSRPGADARARARASRCGSRSSTTSPSRPRSTGTASSWRASPTACRAGAARRPASCRAIAPGDTFVAEFVPPRAGTFIYHTHANEQLQMGSGLYGAAARGGLGAAPTTPRPTR